MKITLKLSRFTMFMLAAVAILAAARLLAFSVPTRFELPQGEGSLAPKTAFFDKDGGAISLDGFKGKVVVLNFWATWCHPCMKEIPSLDRLATRLPSDRFAVVAVNEDKGGWPVAKPVLERLQIRNLAFYADRDARLSRDLGARGFPTTVLIGRDGEVVGKREGAVEWDEEGVISYLLSLRP